jgi:outer membrane protease
MKSIVFFSVFVCLVFHPPLRAEGSFPYTLSIAPQFGLLYGQGEEQVFRDEDSGELLSQLLWDLKPLYYGGVKLDFAQKNPLAGFGFFSSLSFKFGFPMDSGVMEDRDWQGPGWELSNYSRHKVFSDGALIFDLAAGPHIPVGSFLALRLSLGLSYTRFAWTARDGYLRYGNRLSNNKYEALKDSDPSRPVSGAVVSYTQSCLFMPLGLFLMILPDRLFSGALWFYGGPVLKFAGTDEHFFRNSSTSYGQFWDDMSGGYVLEPGGEFRFSPMERLSLRLYCSWRRVAAMPHGKSLGRYTGNGDWRWNSLGNFSGGLFQTTDLGIGLEVRL